MPTTLPAGWKPIESAPKDGSLILLGCPDEGPDGRPALCLPGYWLKGWCDAPDDMGQDDGWVDVQHTDFYPGRSFGSPDYMRKGSQPTHWMPLPAAPGTPPASAQDAPITVSLDPDPRGVSVGVWQGSRCIYNGAHAVPVAQDDAKDERSDTYGMNLGERIAHVGGRTNAQGYTEFGSPMAVNALIQHVLRDIDWTRQDDDGAYQARYRLRDGQWSSWGHVVCGVKGHEQELRYLPAARRPSPAAGDARDAARLDWIAQNAWAVRSLQNGRKNALVWQQPRTSTEGGLDRLRAAIDAALSASQQQEG